VEALSTLYLNSTAATEFAPYFVLMVVLLIRPEGLFGQHRIDRV
jgi:branched-subunit amino acid ABC-type transport system permease component